MAQITWPPTPQPGTPLPPFDLQSMIRDVLAAPLRDEYDRTAELGEDWNEEDLW